MKGGRGVFGILGEDGELGFFGMVGSKGNKGECGKMICYVMEWGWRVEKLCFEVVFYEEIGWD